MDQIKVSSPGKLMLLGEHAVVYSRPCIVTAVNQRMKIIINLLKEPILELEAADIDVRGYNKPISEVGKAEIAKGARFVEIAVYNFINKYPFKGGLHIETTSEFSSQFGFGSSSASTVCAFKALADLFNIKLTLKEIFDLSYKTVLNIQGKGSGFDVAAATYGGTIYFLTGGKKIEPLDGSDLELVVGYSGVKSDTITMVNLVREKMNSQKEKVEKIFDAIAELVEKARKAIEENDWPSLGKLMNYNQDYLEDLGVSTEKLNNMIMAARKGGAYGAKLSGAGGGDCMIASVSAENKAQVAQAIEYVGGQVINIDTNAPGVKVENNII